MFKVTYRPMRPGEIFHVELFTFVLHVTQVTIITDYLSADLHFMIYTALSKGGAMSDKLSV